MKHSTPQEHTGQFEAQGAHYRYQSGRVHCGTHLDAVGGCNVNGWQEVVGDVSCSTSLCQPWVRYRAYVE